ncbi:MAG: SdrD B-like domain-containing protein, partial [Mariprofundaceae bacterium]|nr:SdrD B-like domain-containing protein [Mariprofundaceae bacterium]
MLHSQMSQASQAFLSLRNNATHLLCAFFFFIVSLSMTFGHAQALTIQNTAQLQYLGAPASSVLASANINASILGRATLQITLGSTAINAGNTTGMTINIQNTDSKKINGAVLTLKAPLASIITIFPQAQQYSFQTLANGDVQITFLNPILPTTSLSIAAKLKIAAATAVGNVSIQAKLNSQGQTVASNNASLQIQNVRTFSSIAFKRLNSAKQFIPAGAYHSGETVFVEVNDSDQNHDPYSIESIIVTLVDKKTGDREQLSLTETAANTGMFLASILSTSASPTQNDNQISVLQGSELSASYRDPTSNADISAAAVLVDPFGVLFNTSTGQPIDGIQITMIDVATGQAASVFGDDGVSTYPSTLITGGTATDSSGRIYQLASGSYRFPFVAPGRYVFQLRPMAGFTHPSTVPTPAFQALVGAPFAIVSGSRAEVFVVNSGSALHIDIPLDPDAASLFLRKTSSKTSAAIGDVVQYTITIENPSTISNATNLSIQDVLPPHFRYQANSAMLDGVSIANPIIQADGRTLVFALGTAGAATSQVLSYVTNIGAGASLGQATNTAFATAQQQATAIQSNQAQATIQVSDDFMRSKGFLIGRVFIDEDPYSDAHTQNGFNDTNEKGVSGVRIYLEDGTFTVTDEDGFYHFNGLKVGRHVVQLDTDSLSNRYQII